MDPSNPQPVFELPPPGHGQAEQAPAPQPMADQQPMVRPEFLPNVGNAPSQAVPQQQPMMNPLQAMPPAAAQPAPVMPAQAPAVQAPVSAHDSDLIEKEWVERAKEIVARTRQDPYQQNREINKFKAEYIKKRYNKDIKVAE